VCIMMSLENYIAIMESTSFAMGATYAGQNSFVHINMSQGAQGKGSCPQRSKVFKKMWNVSLAY